MLMQESGSSNDFEQVRVELHNDELIVRREAGRKSTSRPLKNVCLNVYRSIFLPFFCVNCLIYSHLFMNATGFLH